MSEHSIARVAARVKALAVVSRELESRRGLAEADRLGLKVCAEILEEAVHDLGPADKLNAAQAKHLEAPAKELLARGDELAHSATPAQIAAWWRALDPAARDFARAVHDLPHR
jgi:hypothetical protein